jgi:hypothetical protein
VPNKKAGGIKLRNNNIQLMQKHLQAKLSASSAPEKSV